MIHKSTKLCSFPVSFLEDLKHSNKSSKSQNWDRATTKLILLRMGRSKKRYKKPKKHHLMNWKWVLLSFLKLPHSSEKVDIWHSNQIKMMNLLIFLDTVLFIYIVKLFYDIYKSLGEMKNNQKLSQYISKKMNRKISWKFLDKQSDFLKSVPMTRKYKSNHLFLLSYKNLTFGAWKDSYFFWLFVPFWYKLPWRQLFSLTGKSTKARLLNFTVSTRTIHSCIVRENVTFPCSSRKSNPIITNQKLPSIQRTSNPPNFCFSLRISFQTHWI